LARYLSRGNELGNVNEAGPSALLERRKKEVEKALADACEAQGWVASASREVLGAGGKRLRPLLAVLVCEAISGAHEAAIPVAVAYELAHAASLVQDDIIDESTVRHGAQTAHKRWGLSKAILLSDSLIFEIFTQLSKYSEERITKDGLSKLLSLLGEAARLAAEGELLEVSLSTRGEVTEEEYSKVIGLKTGALFAASAASGAVAARADTALVGKMYEFGLALGTAFQIGDDILDLAGDAKSTGKPVFKDIENNAGNIVIVHALSIATPMQKNTINSLLFKKWFTELESEKLLQTLTELDSFAHAASILNEQTARSRRLMGNLPKCPAREALELLISGIEVRRK